jgi:hypothetical protein
MIVQRKTINKKINKPIKSDGSLREHHQNNIVSKQKNMEIGSCWANWYNFAYCFIWALTVFDSRMLRNIFVRKREDVRGDWRKLHNEKLQNLPKNYSDD